MELPTYIHIVAAGIALIAGTIALMLSKGSDSHKRAGHVFTITMVIMVIPAGFMSYALGKYFDVLSSVFTCYMVLTGLLSFRPNADSQLKAFMGLAALCIVGYLTVEISTQLTGARATDAPVGAGYVFVTVLLLSVWGDLRLLSQPSPRRSLLIRHLWRMNVGFFMATFNLFGVRPHLFPEWMQSSGILVLLAIAPILVMIYWRIRLRLGELVAS